MKHKRTRSTSERRSLNGDDPVVSPAIEEQIDENLRLIYRQCLEEGIPDSMQALMDRLATS